MSIRNYCLKLFGFLLFLMMGSCSNDKEPDVNAECEVFTIKCLKITCEDEDGKNLMTHKWDEYNDYINGINDAYAISFDSYDRENKKIPFQYWYNSCWGSVIMIWGNGITAENPLMVYYFETKDGSFQIPDIRARYNPDLDYSNVSADITGNRVKINWIVDGKMLPIDEEEYIRDKRRYDYEHTPTQLIDSIISRVTLVRHPDGSHTIKE